MKQPCEYCNHAREHFNTTSDEDIDAFDLAEESQVMGAIGTAYQRLTFIYWRNGGGKIQASFFNRTGDSFDAAVDIGYCPFCGRKLEPQPQQLMDGGEK